MTRFFPVDPPKLAKPLLERLKERHGARTDPGGHDADPVHPASLLRLSGERCGDRASQGPEEDASIHPEELTLDRQACGLCFALTLPLGLSWVRQLSRT